jgi:hypothetical protein
VADAESGVALESAGGVLEAQAAARSDAAARAKQVFLMERLIGGLSQVAYCGDMIRAEDLSLN